MSDSLLLSVLEKVDKIEGKFESTRDDAKKSLARVRETDRVLVKHMDDCGDRYIGVDAKLATITKWMLGVMTLLFTVALGVAGNLFVTLTERFVSVASSLPF